MTETTETTSYVSRLSIMIECDYLEERERSLDTVALIRLQNAMRTGETVPSDACQTVVKLQQKLEIPAQKRITTTVVPTTRRGRYSPGRDTAILSDPLGPYYTKFTVPFPILNTPEVANAWDTNPVEVLEVSMIPENANPQSFTSNRFVRTGMLSMHFQSGRYSDVFTLLMAIRSTCMVLELRNVQANDKQIQVLQQRLKPGWPNLNKIILPNRGTT